MRDGDSSMYYKARARGQQKEFVEIFSINKETGEQEAVDHDKEQSIIEEERDLD